MRQITGCFIFSVLLFFGPFHPAWSQTKPVEGLRKNTPQVHALTNARIVQSSERVLEKGTIVVRDGVIEAVGSNIKVPADAYVWDYSGLSIYPGLIDAYSHLGLPEAKKKSNDANGSKNESESTKYWNDLVRPETEITATFSPSKEDIENLRKLGFTAALIVPRNGIFKGASSLVSLSDSENQKRIVSKEVAQHVAFARHGGFRGAYPTSLMGSVATIRQALLDADWYGKAHAAYRQNPNQLKPEENESLAALSKALTAGVPFVFEVPGDQDVLLALKIAKEFGLNAWLRGGGYEYRVIESIKTAGVPLIIPLNFPKAPAVDTPEEALDVSLQELSHWEVAPANPRFLQERGIAFALTTADLKESKEFNAVVAKAIENGLSNAAALKALTKTPANLLGLGKQLGSIDAGKLAHLVVSDGELFTEKSKILDVWIDGSRHEIEARPPVKPEGSWRLTIDSPTDTLKELTLELSGDARNLHGKIKKDSTEVKLEKTALNQHRINLVLDGKELQMPGFLTLSGRVADKTMKGQGITPTGEWVSWKAEWISEIAEQSKTDTSKQEQKQLIPLPVGSPPGAYGLQQIPEQKTVLVRNATIWTSSPQGNLENSDLLISNGKISSIGNDLQAPEGAVIIDGTGKHMTPGLIDAHSHGGIRIAGNEVGQAVTAEVRISDTRDPHDIAFYRELAGGLTVANTLHGSANPIGGQNEVIKLRWGSAPEELVIKDAIPGIKFALGENVKQSNWGDKFTTRYPQTRMGVEQIIRDRFKAAQDYEREWRTYRSLKRKTGVIPPRRDLELDALVEILNGKRLVHSHSYRQDEILMLCRIAEDFGFTIGTFQHVLEGYKVAEALAQHGAGASTFSDWWAYKFEVYDAIPYNGALMHNAGVVVSFNSDSDELARHMNLEAAKAVKYGGVSEEEALKFVTLNPAKQLRIDHRVGSLEVGKDGDFAIWSGHPLSTFTKCEQTWIEGRQYFSLEKDMEMRGQIKTERARLMQKVMAADESAKPAKKNKTGSTGE